MSNLARLQVSGVLFDLDGTLVNSAPDIGNAANKMLQTMGEPLATKQQIRSWIGNGIPKLVKRALTKSVDAEPDASLFEYALPIFMMHYERDVCVDSTLYPGVLNTLKDLSANGYVLGCVTNKQASCTEPLLDQIGIASYFSAVVSGDTCKNRKPHPEPIHYLIKKMGLTEKDCLLVGDSAHDIGAAKAAGIPAIAVTYGYHQGIDLSTLSAQAVVDNFGDIVQYMMLK